MFELLIRNARLVDGTGSPERSADLGVIDGRIAEIGKLREPAGRIIDADGQVLAPGFVDIHTHYDAQVFWDPTIGPSCYHGVTTVLAGNCGFSIAPLSKDAAPYLLRMLARVEGMPEASLKAGVPWDWESFAEYLSRLEGRVGVNMGFMCGHSALRRVVMGERALHAEASDDELSAMAALLEESLCAGAMGFSSSASATHNDAEGHPVPSRHANRNELIALAGACRNHPGTILEFLPGVSAFTDEQMQLMTEMSLAAQRSLNWNALSAAVGNEALLEHQLSATDYARRAGAEVIGLTMSSSPSVRLNFHSGFLLDGIPGWAEVFKMPIRERIELFRDPERRSKFAACADPQKSDFVRSVADWGKYVICDSRNKALEGRRIGDLAEREGKSPLDVMLDIAISDELRTVFLVPPRTESEALWKLRSALWRDERTILGATDAGAHLDMIDAFTGTTYLLAAVREHSVMSLEEGVQKLTQIPANLMGLRDRGVIRKGFRADLVVFDPDTIRPMPTALRNDLPGDEMRLFSEAEGIAHVIVNGCSIIENGAHTGALPGHVLHSGIDTETRLPGMSGLN